MKFKRTLGMRARMTIADAMATYGVPAGTDIDNDGTIDLDDLYYVLRNYDA